MDLDLKGRKVLMTGATHGLGLEIARHFAREGCSIALGSRTEARVRAACSELMMLGSHVFGRRLDLSIKQSVCEFVKESVEALGGVDIVVHAASALVAKGPDRWSHTFQVDVQSVVDLMDTVIPTLRQSNAPAVVFLGSTAALETWPDAMDDTHAYGPMKAALRAYVRQLAETLGRVGIRVNMVSPGPIDQEDGPWERIKQHDEAHYQRVAAGSPMSRLGRPDEVANVVLFLCSSRASWVHGENILVDGGQHRQVR